MNVFPDHQLLRLRISIATTAIINLCCDLEDSKRGRARFCTSSITYMRRITIEAISKSVLFFATRATTTSNTAHANTHVKITKGSNEAVGSAEAL